VKWWSRFCGKAGCSIGEDRGGRRRFTRTKKKRERFDNSFQREDISPMSRQQGSSRPSQEEGKYRAPGNQGGGGVGGGSGHRRLTGCRSGCRGRTIWSSRRRSREGENSEDPDATTTGRGERGEDKRATFLIQILTGNLVKASSR